MPPFRGWVYRLIGMVLSLQRGSFIPLLGHMGGTIAPLWWFCAPFSLVLSPHLAGGRGLSPF